MEQDRKTLRITTNHRKILEDSIKKFNEVYKTDFKLIEYTQDEVNFAMVEYNLTTPNQIFDFGYQFGALINHLRLSNTITD